MNSFKILKFLSEGNKTFDQVPVAEQIEYMESLGNPSDDLERSYLQYKCQQYFCPLAKKIAFNVVSFFVTPFMFLFLIVKSIFIKKMQSIDAVGEFKGLEEIVPKVLNEEFEIDNTLWNTGFLLKPSDLNFLLKLFIVAPLSPYFFLKAMIKVASYSYLIHTFAPKAILVHGEYSYCSSLLTKYCEERGVEHINMMHGEKIFYIGYAFFRYTRCYVWDGYYKDLLLSLKAESQQFKIAIPPSLLIDTEKEFDKDCYADVKYFLQIFDEEKIQKIVNSMAVFENDGKKVVYRPHPRFSDMKLLEKYVDKEKIEKTRDVSIIKSVASLSAAVGYCSTVLFQVYLAGKDVILDDIAYKEENSKLKEYKYILASKESVHRLTEFQK